MLHQGPQLVNECLRALMRRLGEEETPDHFFSNAKEVAMGLLLHLVEIQKSCFYVKALLSEPDPLKKWKQAFLQQRQRRVTAQEAENSEISFKNDRAQSTDNIFDLSPVSSRKRNDFSSKSARSGMTACFNLTNQSHSISAKSHNLRLSANQAERDNTSFSHFTVRSRDSNYKREELHHLLKKIQIDTASKQVIVGGSWDREFLATLRRLFSESCSSPVVPKLRQFGDLLLFLDDFALKAFLLDKGLAREALDDSILVELYSFVTKLHISPRQKEELHSGLQRLLRSEIFSTAELTAFLKRYLKVVFKSCHLEPVKAWNILGKSRAHPPGEPNRRRVPGDLGSPLESQGPSRGAPLLGAGQDELPGACQVSRSLPPTPSAGALRILRSEPLRQSAAGGLSAHSGHAGRRGPARGA